MLKGDAFTGLHYYRGIVDLGTHSGTEQIMKSKATQPAKCLGMNLIVAWATPKLDLWNH